MQSRNTASTIVHGANLALRTVVAAYVLAAAVALAIDPTQPIPLGSLLGTGIVVPLSAVYLFATGSLLMLGLVVRPAALLLCGYLFCDAWGHLVTLAPGAFWNDIALLVTVLLVSSNDRRLAAATRSQDAEPA